MIKETNNINMKGFEKEATKWYVLYTMSHAEKQVEQRLKTLPVEIFLPLHLSPRKWSDRIKLVEMPIFPSYIFVKTTDSKLRSLLLVQGVSRIVFYDGKPAILRDSEIVQIKAFLEKAQKRNVIFHSDEDVLIACGPFRDLSGTIKKISKKQIVLRLEQLGIWVSVSPDQILKKQVV